MIAPMSPRSDDSNIELLSDHLGRPSKQSKVDGVARECLISGVAKTGEIRPHYLEEKDGSLWVCVERIPGGNLFNEVGEGFIYLFKPNKKIKDPNLKNNENYPATEPSEYRLAAVDMMDPLFQFGFSSIKKPQQLFVPDINAISYHISKFKGDATNYPFVSVDGVASHRVFARAFGEGKVLVSKNAEFIHDNYFHVIPYINRRLSQQEELLKPIREEVLNIVNNLDAAEIGRLASFSKRDLLILDMSIGMFTDYISSFSNLSEFPYPINQMPIIEMIANMWGDSLKNRVYFNKELIKHGFEPLTSELKLDQAAEDEKEGIRTKEFVRNKLIELYHLCRKV